MTWPPTTRPVINASQWPKRRPLITGLVDPRLTGAACVGHAHLFDAAHPNEPRPDRAARHRAAVEICQRCPVLAPCATVAAELGARAVGVWAGRSRTPRY